MPVYSPKGPPTFPCELLPPMAAKSDGSGCLNSTANELGCSTDDSDRSGAENRRAKYIEELQAQAAGEFSCYWSSCAVAF